MHTSAKRAVVACALFAGTTALSLIGSAAAHAAETITYQYDAKGRLVQVAHSGSVNDGVVANYSFDLADSRSNLTVSGSSFNSPPQRVIVVPLNGMTVISLPSP